MHVYVQKSMRTTFPRRSSVLSGDELSQPVAPSRPGRCPSEGRAAASLLRRLLNKLTAALLSAKRPEGGTNLRGEELRLLPGREVVETVASGRRSDDPTVTLPVNPRSPDP